MSGPANHQKPFWKSLSKLDWIALAVVLLGIWAWLVRQPCARARGDAFLAASFRCWRCFTWPIGPGAAGESELLWSLRNRLIVAYVFIAVVPMSLLVMLARPRAADYLRAVGSYILHQEIHRRVDLLADSAAHIAAAEETLPASINQKSLEQALATQIENAEGKTLPGLVVKFHVTRRLLPQIRGPKAHSFAGLVQTENQLRLASMREVESPRGKQILALSVPVTANSWKRGLRPWPVNMLFGRVKRGQHRGDASPSARRSTASIGRVTTHKRSLPPASSWTDPVVDDLSHPGSQSYLRRRRRGACSSGVRVLSKRAFRS